MIWDVKLLEEFNDTYSLISIGMSSLMTNLYTPNSSANKVSSYSSRLLLHLTFDK